jgi:CheY-like chemotaxis protein
MSTSFSKTSQSIGRKATNGTGSYFPRTLPPNAPATLPTPPTSGNSLTYAPGDAIHTMNLANLEGLHILIVEDNKIAQSVLVQQLRTTLKSCTVSTADHGGEALAFLTLSTSSSSSKDSCTFLPSSSSPSATLPESQREKQSENSVAKRSVDIILMDLEMPVMDGLTCVRRIRELQSQSQSHSKGCGSGSGSIARISKNLKIIAVTANARGERVEEARRGGMDGVLTKPFRVPELVGLMQSVLVGTDTRKPAKEVADRMARPAAESVAGRTPSRRSTRARAKAKAKA